jgi:hypothetical protein
MIGEWKAEEVQYVIDNRNTMTVLQLSEKLNRSIGSIQGKIMQLGIKKKSLVSIGTKINRLTVLSLLENGLLECQCKCEKTLEITKGRLYGKNAIKSCGCHKKIAKRLVDIKTVSPKTYSYRFLYARYLNNAKVSNTPFTLTFEEFTKMMTQNCTYCGIEPKPFNPVLKQKKLTEHEKRAYYVNVNGIDRIDSQIGYTVTNTTCACKECNYAKRCMSLSEWYAYLDRIFKFISTKDKSKPPMDVTKC